LKFKDFSLFSSSPPSLWTGFDLSGGLFAVSLSAGKPGVKPRVIKHVAVVGKDPDAFALAELNQAVHSKGADRTFVIARGEYQVFQVDKPAVKAEEAEKSLGWALGSLIDYPVTQANVSWLDIPHESQAAKQAKVYLVAVKKEIVDHYDQLFAKAKANLQAADIRETANRNIAALAESGQQGVCLVFAEKTGVQITITFQGELFLERFIREPLYPEPGMSTEDPEQVDRVALEIQRSLDFIRRAYPTISIEEVTVGPTLKDIKLAHQLKSRMTEPIRQLDLSNLFEWPEGSDLTRPEVQALYFYALGAALRGRKAAK